MSLRLIPACLSVSLLFAADVTDPTSLVAHEWGTFTSVAGYNGTALRWQPGSGSNDLPCFVHRLGNRNLKIEFATVRMETPVLYFYTPRPLTVSVRADFPNGWLTEWYPQATHVRPETRSDSLRDGRLEWNDVE